MFHMNQNLKVVLALLLDGVDLRGPRLRPRHER